MLSLVTRCHAWLFPPIETTNQEIHDTLPIIPYSFGEGAELNELSKEKVYKRVTKELGLLWGWRDEETETTTYVRAVRNGKSYTFKELKFSELHEAVRGLKWSHRPPDPRVKRNGQREQGSFSQSILLAFGAISVALLGKKMFGEVEGEVGFSANMGDFTSAIGIAAFLSHHRESRRFSVLPTVAAIGITRLSFAAAANSPPVPRGIRGDVHVLPGQNITLRNLEQDFFDPDGDILKVSFLDLPGFVEVDQQDNKILQKFFGLFPQAFVKQENVLYFFGSDLGIWDFTNPIAPQQLGSLPLGGEFTGVIAGRYGYMSTHFLPYRFYVIDVEEKTSPQIVSFLDFNYGDHSIIRLDPTRPIAWVARDNGVRAVIHAIDISIPTQPQEVGFYNGSMYSISSFFSPKMEISNDGFLYFGSYAFETFDVRDPSNLYREGALFSELTDIESIEIREQTLFVAGSYDEYFSFPKQGIWLYNLTNPLLPEFLHGYEGLYNTVHALSVSGEFAFAGLRVLPETECFYGAYNLSDTTNPSPSILLPVGFGEKVAQSLIDQNRLFFTTESSVLWIIDLFPVHLEIHPELSDLGTYPITVMATDDRGGVTSYPLNIIVQLTSSLPPEFSQSSSLVFSGSQTETALVSLSLAGGIFVGVCLLGGIGGFVYLMRKKRKANRQISILESKNVDSTFVLSFHQRENLTGTFGESGRLYGWINFAHVSEREEANRSTGLEIENESGCIFTEENVSMRLCTDVKNQYKLAILLHTSDLKEKANLLFDQGYGEGIPIIENRFFEEEKSTWLLEAPYYGSLSDLRKKLLRALPKEKMEEFASLIGKDLLETMQRLHKQRIGFSSFRMKTIFINKKGSVQLVDCSEARKMEKIEKRYLQAIGILLFQFMKGDDAHRNDTGEFAIDEALSKTHELQNPQAGSLWEAIKRFFTEEPFPDVLGTFLRMPCFKTAQEDLFISLNRTEAIEDGEHNERKIVPQTGGGYLDTVPMIGTME